MRLTRPALLSFALVGVVAACSAGPAPGWTYAPAPPATPTPAATAGGAPSAAPSGEPTGVPSGAPAVTLELVASGIAFDARELTVPAGQPFAIRLVNRNPAGVPHDVDIETADGAVLQDQPVIDGGEETTYRYTALEAGEYVFQCSIHPIPAMTGTLIVR